jgi:hypothetical protein
MGVIVVFTIGGHHDIVRCFLRSTAFGVLTDCLIVPCVGSWEHLGGGLLVHTIDHMQ